MCINNAEKKFGINLNLVKQIFICSWGLTQGWQKLMWPCVGVKKIHVHLDNHISHSRSQARNFLTVDNFLQDNSPYILFRFSSW